MSTLKDVARKAQVSPITVSRVINTPEKVKAETCERVRRVSDFQFIAGGYELRAIPETCGRFYCQAVDGCRNDECKPTHKVVYGSVLFH